MKSSRSILFFILATLASLAAGAQTLREQAERDQTRQMASEEPPMARAFSLARSTLDGFLAMAKHPPEHYESLAIKVKIMQGRDAEYFWVTPFRPDGNEFTGTLNNEPRLVRNLKFGQKIRFQKSQIVDWTYFDTLEGRTRGNFTVCALLTKESPKERAEALEKYRLDCNSVWRP